MPSSCVACVFEQGLQRACQVPGRGVARVLAAGAVGSFRGGLLWQTDLELGLHAFDEFHAADGENAAQFANSSRPKDSSIWRGPAILDSAALDPHDASPRTWPPSWRPTRLASVVAGRHTLSMNVGSASPGVDFSMHLAAIACALFGATFGGCGTQQDRGSGRTYSQARLSYFEAEPIGQHMETDGLPNYIPVLLRHPNMVWTAQQPISTENSAFVNVGPDGMYTVSGEPSTSSEMELLYHRVEQSLASKEESLGVNKPAKPTRRLVIYPARSVPWTSIANMLADWPITFDRRWEVCFLGIDGNGEDVALLGTASAPKALPDAALLTVRVESGPWRVPVGLGKLHIEYEGATWTLPSGGYEVAQPTTIRILNAFMAGFAEAAWTRRATVVRIEIDALARRHILVLHVMALLDVLRGAGAQTVELVDVGWTIDWAKPE